MRRIFEFDGESLDALREAYAPIVRSEFYDGDLDFDEIDRPRIQVDKALADPIGLLNINTNFGIKFRRTRAHIRQRNGGLRVIWFVRHGHLKITRSSSTCSVREGEATILDSSVPFVAHIWPDAEGQFEASQVVVPAHLFISHLQEVVGHEQPFVFAPEGEEVLTKLLGIFFADGDSLSKPALDALATGFLETLRDKIGLLPDSEKGHARSRILDQRINDITEDIVKNLTDPELTYIDVAHNCGISPRYLCYVLKASGTSFSKILWSHRLPKAREWLTSPALQSYPIQEIAFMAGFKSAAHFSRMFKSNYGCSPKDFRTKFSDSSRCDQLTRTATGDREENAEDATEAVLSEMKQAA